MSHDGMTVQTSLRRIVFSPGFLVAPILLIATLVLGCQNPVNPEAAADTTAPRIGLDGSLAYVINHAKPSLLCPVTDEGSGVDPESFTWTPGVKVLSKSAGGVEFKLTEDPFPPGKPVAVSVFVADRAGNTASMSFRVVQICTAPSAPYLEWPNKLPPWSWSWKGVGDGYFGVTLTRDEGSSSEFLVNPLTARVDDPSKSYQWTGDQPLPAGSYSLSVVRVDAAGNISPPLQFAPRVFE